MASYDDLMTIAGNSGFQARCHYALMNVALYALSEINTTANHQKRVNYALQILNGNANLKQTAIALVNQSNIAAEAVLLTTPDYAVPDTDIYNAVNSLFNTFANVVS